MAGLVHGKLGPGLVPDFAVERPRLDHVLDAAWRRPATLVVAPAGYGKSTLLSQWANRHEHDRLSWLSIDDRDVDPVRFGTHLLATLAATCPEAGEQSGRALGSAAGAMGVEFVDLLLGELQSLDDDAVLVLEDVDRLAGSPILEDLARLVLELPPTLHLVIAARVDPNLGLHRLRTRDALGEVRAADLRFRRDEAAAVVERLTGRELADDEASYLAEITEGWPVAVQLAAISLRTSGVDGPVVAFDGSDRNIVDYLSAELLQRAPHHLRSFLLDVSVLETMNGELCDAVTGRSDGARMLAELEQHSLFVTPISGEPGWWRQHRLVREFLLGDLRIEAPQRAAELRRRAADWHLVHGDPAQAAGYLVEAGAWDELLELIDLHGRALWDQGHATTLHQLVESVPAGVRRRSARNQLIEAGVRIVAGRPEAGAATLAEMDQGRDLTRGEAALVDVLRCALVLEVMPTQADIGRVDAALAVLSELTPADVPVILGSTSLDDSLVLTWWSSAQARALLGDGTAIDHARRALDAPPSTRVTFQVNVSGLNAWFDALRGRSRSASSHATRAFDLAARRLGLDHVATVYAAVARSVSARMADDLDSAMRHADDALVLAERWNRRPMASFLLAEQAVLALASGDLDAAAEWVRRARRSPSTSMIDGRLRSVELRMRVARGEIGAAWHELDSVGLTSSWELASAAVAAAVQVGEPGRARKYLDQWPTSCSPFGDLERELAVASVEHVEGDTGAATDRITSLLLQTGPEGVIRPYLDAGDPVILLLEEGGADRPRAHVEAILQAARRQRSDGGELVDPLSARELEVLAHLPTRLSNAQIAEALYVSTNTVKTHIKHIYQKLAAADRDDAVRRAEELGLL